MRLLHLLFKHFHCIFESTHLHRQLPKRVFDIFGAAELTEVSEIFVIDVIHLLEVQPVYGAKARSVFVVRTKTSTLVEMYTPLIISDHAYVLLILIVIEVLLQVWARLKRSEFTASTAALHTSPVLDLTKNLDGVVSRGGSTSRMTRSPVRELETVR